MHLRAYRCDRSWWTGWTLFVGTFETHVSHETRNDPFIAPKTHHSKEDEGVCPLEDKCIAITSLGKNEWETKENDEKREKESRN